jgi:hypothetical protein
MQTITDDAFDSSEAIPWHRRRREGVQRLRGGDPWLADHCDWRDRHDLAMARSGLAPRWQVECARRAWAEGVR